MFPVQGQDRLQDHVTTTLRRGVSCLIVHSPPQETVLYYSTDNGVRRYDITANRDEKVRIDRLSVDGVTKMHKTLNLFGIESLSNGLLILGAYDSRVWIANPRNGRSAVLVNARGESGSADGDALEEAELIDPSGLCVFDDERKLIITEHRPKLLRELTFPTSFDPKLFF